MSFLYNIFVIFVVTAIAVYGDTFLKAATTTTGSKQIINLGLGVIIYAFVAFGFFYMYKLMSFSASGVIYALITILLYMGVGLFLYKESINIYEWVGVGLAVISVFLLSRFA